MPLIDSFSRLNVAEGKISEVMNILIETEKHREKMIEKK
jgi:hypothetical protein